MNLETILYQAEKLAAEARWEEALALSEEAGGAECARLWTIRAQALNSLERYEEAEAACEKALLIEPQEREALFAKALCLYMRERWQEALAPLECLACLPEPLPDGLWFRAGVIKRLNGEMAEATVDAYCRAVEADPQNLYARAERAALLRAHGRYDDALEDYEAAMESSDEELRAEAAFGYGCTALVLNKSENALAAFRTVLDIAPDYPDVKDMHDMLAAEMGMAD